MVVEVVINLCYGGFGLSQVALKNLVKMGVPLEGPRHDYASDHLRVYWYLNHKKRKTYALVADHDLKTRSDPRLVAVVKKLDKRAWGDFANLAIVEVPRGVGLYLAEYDGIEWIETEHQVFPEDLQNEYVVL